MESNFIVTFAITCYFIGGLIAGIRFFVTGSGELLPRGVGISFGLVGALAHGIFLYQNIPSDSGINLGFYDAASLVSWIIVLMLMSLEITKPVYNLSIVVLPTAALIILLETQFPGAHFLAADAPQGLRIHVVVSMLAYSLLTLSSGQAVLLAIQDYQLRNRRPGGFIQALPPLQTMETLLFRMIGMGFVLFTIALISGFQFLEDMFTQRLVYKSVLSITAWLVFGMLLWGRFRFGWRGQTAQIWTLVGLVVLMLVYFVSRFVAELTLITG